MSKKLKSLIIMGLIISALTVAGLSVYAASTSNTTSNTQENMKIRKGHAEKNMDFSSFVSQGIIDQATADKMKDFMKQFKIDRMSKMESMKSMTEEERKAFFENNKAEFDPFSQMVSQGIITQDQADAIKASMPEKRKSRCKFDLSDMVKQGVIDQETADKIKAYMNQK